MPVMLNLEKELIRISPKNGKHIEYSLNQGQTWYLRFQGYQTGVFYDIADGGKELLATTENGGLTSAVEVPSASLNIEFAFRQTSLIVCAFSLYVTKVQKFINPLKLIFSAVDEFIGSFLFAKQGYDLV